MLLHTVNKSPFERDTFDSCLRHAREGSSILLIEDGVYGALARGAFAPRVTAALEKISIYALRPDVEARGLQQRVLSGIRLVDYAGFVDLVVRHDAVQSWL